MTFPSDSAVLELGCGHALPTLAAMRVLHTTTSAFVLLDFNEEVLRYTTWPNIIANCPESSQKHVICLAGDWELLAQHCRTAEGVPRFFGLILTAETLYTEESTRKVFSTICSLLCVGGLAAVASKRYYFGVGGGVGLFLSLIAECKGSIEVAHRVAIEDGTSNVRDIIVLKKIYQD